MKSSGTIRLIAVGISVSALALFTGVIVGSNALAQVSGFYETDNPYVSVDLSVLGGDAPAGMGSKALVPGFTGTLQIPAPTPPQSQLHVSPAKGTGSLPTAAKSRVAMTPPGGPSMPPEKPPVSSVNIPGAQIPEPTKTEPKPVEPPAPAQPAAAPEAPPAPTVTAAVTPKPAEQAEKAPEKPAKPVVVSQPAADKAADTMPPPPTVAAPEPTPEPAKAAATEPKPEPAQQAALPPAGGKMEPGKTFQVVFEASASKLPEDVRSQLSDLVASIVEQSNLRLQLLAYAGGESLSPSKARRLSLSRALSLRSFLIENGLRSTRIDVRALGNKTADEPVNRVDINVVER